MNKLKVLILGCGGTIAMVPNADGVLVPAKTVNEITALVPLLATVADLELIQLENRDSTELQPSHWTKFARAIADAVASEKFVGIIVTHGTDTMAYSATAVSLVLGQTLPIPVVFTGSQLPLVNFGTDARFNLENAMQVILQAHEKGIAEVMIVFNDVVLRAARSMKTKEADFLAFDSPAFPPLARISATGVAFTAEAQKKRSENFDKDHLHTHFERGVVVLELVPGFEPGILFDIIRGGKCRAIILCSLGAGNVPSTDEYSLIPCIEEATRNDIPVVITTKFLGGRTHAGIYEPGHKALAAGAIESRDLTSVAVQVKLMWLLAQGICAKKEVQKALLTSVVGEVS